MVTTSPRTIAISYAVFGFLWILTTDHLVNAAIEDAALVNRLQTAKGWVFVALSVVLVYGLVLHRDRQLTETADRLDSALQQTMILHRILRHNLRNSCTVIRGHANLLSDHLEDEPEVYLNRIEAQNERLIELSEKAKRLRDVLAEETVPMARVDLVSTVRSQVSSIRSEHPAVTVVTDLPDTLEIETDERIGRAIYELLENAVEHADSTEPTVRIGARRTDDGSVLIEIADDGPGIPAVERDVLEGGLETSMKHSQGLGLWIASLLTAGAGGELLVEDSDRGGTVVTVALPSSANGPDPSRPPGTYASSSTG